ncbi:hypothetical protein NP493_734g00011 [Ridgeia piscesae]|uniref:Uncharacterized protein n=1 Tax=Ridgeia piscesae TaxID=27915 RepID=A0AAD9NNY8_RIDPI|nr:hypothetical protein NP493_734g00011 [Ridgeia piscesae]
MTLQIQWKAVYNNRKDPQTKEFETNLTHTLIEIYNSYLQPNREVSDVIITDIRKGSVVVEHEVVLKEPFAGAEEEDVRCLINDAVQETDTVVGATASLSQQTVPLLLILGLCYVIEMRAAKQRKAKAEFVGTSVSYRYQDLSRAQKSAPRRLFQGQSMTENADVDGFEPRQI